MILPLKNTSIFLQNISIFFEKKNINIYLPLCLYQSIRALLLIDRLFLSFACQQRAVGAELYS